jgi:hypothetical protein
MAATSAMLFAEYHQTKYVGLSVIAFAASSDHP